MTSGFESQPDDLGWLTSVCILKSLVTFDALLYDLLNCVAFARCKRHRMSTYIIALLEVYVSIK